MTTTWWWPWRGTDGERGAAAVEFALIGPLVFATIAFGFSMFFGLYRQSELERVAEVAARAASVPSDLSVEGRIFRTQMEIEDAVRRTTTGGFESIVITDTQNMPVDPQALQEGQVFNVTATTSFRNPMARLVNLIGTGVVGESNTLYAQAVGVKE
jgi:Flp pilus assembly protein TadG